MDSVMHTALLWVVKSLPAWVLSVDLFLACICFVVGSKKSTRVRCKAVVGGGNVQPRCCG